jgi:hypothetical protein
MGTCSYILVNTTGKDQSLPQFSILTKNELRINSKGSFLKSANIDLSGHRITILSGQRGTVEVGGFQLYLIQIVHVEVECKNPLCSPSALSPL